MRTAADKIGREALARLLGCTDVAPFYTGKRDFYAPGPRMVVLPLALPAQVHEAPFGWSMRKWAPEDRLCVVAFAYVEDEVEALRLTGPAEARVNLALSVLQAKLQWLIQRCARLHTIVDQAKMKLRHSEALMRV
jgi:hypothetical protein